VAGRSALYFRPRVLCFMPGRSALFLSGEWIISCRVVYYFRPGGWRCSRPGSALFQAGRSSLFLAGEWIISGGKECIFSGWVAGEWIISGRYECIVPGWGMDYFRPV
jgi:hypothetical protein